MAQVMPGTFSLLARLGAGVGVAVISRATELVTPALACHTTVPSNASTTRTPRPLVRLKVVALPVAPVMVHDPAAVKLTVPAPIAFCSTALPVDAESRQ